MKILDKVNVILFFHGDKVRINPSHFTIREYLALREMPLRQGLNTSNVVAGPFAAVQLVSQGDPEDLANYRVERLECELRLIDTGRGYRLEMRYPPPPDEAGSDGSWEEIGTTYHPDGSVATMAFRRIKPLDSDAFGLALSRLQSPHPAVAAKLDRGPRGARPMAADERRKHNEEIREAMQAQRRSNALHRRCYEGDMPREERTWLSDMI